MCIAKGGKQLMSTMNSNSRGVIGLPNAQVSVAMPPFLSIFQALETRVSIAL